MLDYYTFLKPKQKSKINAEIIFQTIWYMEFELASNDENGNFKQSDIILSSFERK